MPNDELQYELLFQPLTPVVPPQLDTISWGIQLRVIWHKTQWHVTVAQLDSTDGVTKSWVPNGSPPVMTYMPLDEYLKKLERLFGIS
jgi:hypothetical protein